MVQTEDHSNAETADLTVQVRELVEEAIEGTNLFVVDVEVRGTRGSRVVEIYVDSDDELGVGQLADVSREVEFLLDMKDLIPGRYKLNVSSPGLDKPLRLPRQYRKNVGRPLRVHYQKADGSGATESEGTLKAADEEAIELEVASGDVRRIRLEDIVWAKVRLPW